MLKNRMILCLLMTNDGVFCNSRNFTLQPVGELNWIRKYLDFLAIDELVLLNVDRDRKSVVRFSEQMMALGKLCFVPISAGGGVATLADFETLLDSGADKVVVNTQALHEPDFITAAARRFGSQCVVVSIDCKRRLGGDRVMAMNGSEDTGREAVDWAREVEGRGAGEIFFTSIDRDGTGAGYDLDSAQHQINVFEVFRKTMADLGWVAQFFCDHRLLATSAAMFKQISRDMPVIVDHLGMVPAERGVGDENFQALLKLVGDGHTYVKVSAVYRLSAQYPDYTDARALHDALVRANPNMLMWGTDWPHPSIAAEVMPDDGHLVDLFYDWTPDEKTRRQIMVDTPARLFGE